MPGPPRSPASPGRRALEIPAQPTTTEANPSIFARLRFLAADASYGDGGFKLPRWKAEPQRRQPHSGWGPRRVPYPTEDVSFHPSPSSSVRRKNGSPSVFLPPSPSPYLFKELWRLIASLLFSRSLSTLNRERFDRWVESFARFQQPSRTHRPNTRL